MGEARLASSVSCRLVTRAPALRSLTAMAAQKGALCHPRYSPELDCCEWYGWARQPRHGAVRLLMRLVSLPSDSVPGAQPGVPRVSTSESAPGSLAWLWWRRYCCLHASDITFPSSSAINTISQAVSELP